MKNINKESVLFAYRNTNGKIDLFRRFADQNPHRSNDSDIGFDLECHILELKSQKRKLHNLLNSFK